MGARCPKCHAPLKRIKRDGEVVQLCPKCRGQRAGVANLSPEERKEHVQNLLQLTKMANTQKPPRLPPVLFFGSFAFPMLSAWMAALWGVLFASKTINRSGSVNLYALLAVFSWGWVLGALSKPGFIACLVLLWFVCLSRHRNRWVGIFGSLASTALALAMFQHLVPGFHNIMLWDAVQLSPNSAPFTMYLNFDKPVFGIIYFTLFYRELVSRIDWRALIAAVGFALAPLLAILIPVGMVVGFIAFEPKFDSNFWMWAANNLFIVCVAEEVLFRGFVQRRLGLKLAGIWPTYGEQLGLWTTSVLFGVAHLPGGWSYAILSGIAGYFYGSAFQRTGNILAAILVHFALNAVHYLLFTYPYFWSG